MFIRNAAATPLSFVTGFICGYSLALNTTYNYSPPLLGVSFVAICASGELSLLAPCAGFCFGMLAGLLQTNDKVNCNISGCYVEKRKGY